MCSTHTVALTKLVTRLVTAGSWPAQPGARYINDDVTLRPYIYTHLVEKAQDDVSRPM